MDIGGNKNINSTMAHSLICFVQDGTCMAFYESRLVCVLFFVFLVLLWMSRPSHDNFAEWHKQSATRSTETEKACYSYDNRKRRKKNIYINVPTEITMTLKCTIASKPYLVNLDPHYIFRDTRQLPAIPYNTSDDQVTAMEGLHSTAKKQAGNGRWHIRTILNVSF